MAATTKASGVLQAQSLWLSDRTAYASFQLDAVTQAVQLSVLKDFGAEYRQDGNMHITDE